MPFCACGCSEARIAEIKSGCDEFHHTLRGIFDRNFDKFEMYALRNVTKVPEDIVQQLEAVEEQSKAPALSFSDCTATEEEEARLRESISSLQARILEVSRDCAVLLRDEACSANSTA